MKHKRIFGLVLAVGILGMSALSTGRSIVTKADELDLADQSFMEFVLSDTDYEGDIAYTHSPLYNENLQAHGREYDFTIGEVEGYALLVEIEGVNQTFYEVEELFYNKQSPFAECDGLPIYITHGVYLEYKAEAFYNVADDSLVSAESVAACAYKGFGYFGLNDFVEQTQTVSYAQKTTETYSIQFDLPNYFGSVEGETGCANTAGAILLGYYDRFYENLIPNYQSYIQLGSTIRYKTGTTEILNVVQELCTLMGTNVNQVGTTFSGFQSGMAQYVTSKGYTYTTSSVFTNGSLNMTSYKNSVQNGKPVALFATGFALLNSITESGNVDTISSGYCAAGHVMVGCGYKIDKYYDANGALQDTRNYLKVASGSYLYNIGYFNINGLGNLDKAISVTIS